MSGVREFSADVTLSITTGRLACKFSDVHEAIEFLMGAPVFTHQIPKAMETIRPALLSRHPELDLEDRFGADVFDGIVDFDTAAAWVQKQIDTHGVQPAYELTAMAEYASAFADPVADLVAIRGECPVIVVEAG